MKKFFPIKTATACQLKWNWSTIRLLNGATSSCHRVDSDLITVDTFDTFHNTPKKLEDRRAMLAGQWPTGGCEYCQQIESAGGSSDRMFHLAIPNMSPPELDTNLEAVSVTPRIVEIYFDNVCNMSCIYCWDGFSSKIQQENSTHGRFEKGGVVLDNTAKYVPDLAALTDKFWQWMEHHSAEIQSLNVLGGEPFYQKQLDQCLQFLSTHYNPELKFNVISNLMVPSERFRNYIDQIHQLVVDGRIARFDLTASIDCFGKEQEYVRYGLDLQQWKENFEYLVGQDWITLNINQTLSGLTIKTTPDLLKYINIFRTNREIGHYFSTTVDTHECLHPEIFGPTFFDDAFLEIFENMPDDTWQQKEARKYMLGIQSQLKSKPRNQQKVDQLGILLTEIDRRRNLDWKITFPWLIKELTHVVQ
jgi:organic radical activating enzyme